MQIDNLESMLEWMLLDLTIEETHLIPSLVPNQNYKRTMIFLNIIVDENRDPRIKLLPHTSQRCGVEGTKLLLATALGSLIRRNARLGGQFFFVIGTVCNRLNG